MRPPGVDPDQVGGTVEHAVGRPGAGVEHRQHELHEHVADGARARPLRLGRHQRAGDAGGEELAVGRRAVLGADELPPADALVLGQPALGARGEDLPDAAAEVRQVLGREPGVGAEGEQQVAQHRAGVARGAGEQRRHDERRPVVLRDGDARRRHQVVGRAAAVERRDAPHRVDDVAVEAGEESEAVLARQVVLDGIEAAVGELVAAAALAVVAHRHAARLAAGEVAAFEHDHLEAALGQLVRGAHAADAAAEDDDARGHARRTARPRAASAAGRRPRRAP